MALKTYGAYTPSTRQRVDIDRSGLWKGSPFKGLCHGISSTGGRNSNGHMTSKHRAAYHKRVYRVISFDRRPL
jgi:large subunit ribosomal protein L2